ncbi:MAG: hypothetical protein J0L73_14005 [Verrucomicrobia bacterium]|nr:hypothetical protein [Verrucomicrobiota bacterium]
MKTFLLSLLLITTAAQADQWLVDGKLYKGTIHRLNADRTLVYVTSDWDNYGGSWIKVSSLDSSTRVRLQVAAPQEDAHYKALREQQLQASTLAAAQSAVYNEQQRLAYQRMLAARSLAQPTPQPYVAPRPRQASTSSYGYGTTYRHPQSSYGYGYARSGTHQHHHSHISGHGSRVTVPHVVVPRVPCVVVPRPILIRVN